MGDQSQQKMKDGMMDSVNFQHDRVYNHLKNGPRAMPVGNYPEEDLLALGSIIPWINLGLEGKLRD